MKKGLLLSLLSVAILAVSCGEPKELTQLKKDITAQTAKLDSVVTSQDVVAIQTTVATASKTQSALKLSAKQAEELAAIVTTFSSKAAVKMDSVAKVEAAAAQAAAEAAAAALAAEEAAKGTKKK